MVLYNLYLVLINEIIKVYDNATQSIVYEGFSDQIPNELMSELVHDVEIAYTMNFDTPYLLIIIN